MDNFGFPERFVIQKELGTGGTIARVFLAHDKELGIDVAVKRIQPTIFFNYPELFERLKQKCLRLPLLNHPHLVKSHGFFESTEEAPWPWLVMEYVEGTPLSNLIKQGSLTLEEKISILKQLGNAIAHIHSVGLVHRDIKPSNVMIQEGNTVKLLDFGFACHFNDALKLKFTGEAAGDLHYASPEQWMSDATIDARSDIYSYGITAFELLAGRKPFKGKSIKHVLVGHLSQRVPDLRTFCPQLPKWLEKLVRTCVEKEPAWRYQSMSDVVEELKRGQRRLENGGPLPVVGRKLKNLVCRGSRCEEPLS